jgi:hypothetical protein
MTKKELVVWNYIKGATGLPEDVVLPVAIATGRVCGVDKTRVEEIYRAVCSGIQPGTPPL